MDAQERKDSKFYFVVLFLAAGMIAVAFWFNLKPKLISIYCSDVAYRTTVASKKQTIFESEVDSYDVIYNNCLRDLGLLEPAL